MAEYKLAAAALAREIELHVEHGDGVFQPKKTREKIIIHINCIDCLALGTFRKAFCSTARARSSSAS